MEEIKNRFYNTLDNDNKEKYKTLFYDKNEIDKFNQKLKEFIELQKNNEEIDLSFVHFYEQYDFTDKNSSLNKIFYEYSILEYDENNEDKQRSEISKRISFSNATFKKQIEFIRVTFEKQVSFEGTIFLDNANFQEVIFKEDTEGIEELQGTIFEGVKFYKEAIFNEAEFKGKAKFFRTKFKDYTSFHKTKFYNTVSFENAVSKDLFYFHDVSIGELDLIGFHYEKANFLILTNIDKSNPILTKANFKNKDTARIIKAHFEQQNNITETHDYFIIEQEFYIELLHKDNTSYSNKTINIISLWFNKYVSNYGTDWGRVLIVLFGIGFLLSFIYTFFHIQFPQDVIFNKNEKKLLIFGIFFSIIIYYLFYQNKRIYKLLLFIFIMYYIQGMFEFDILQSTNNKILTLVNPLNIFKSNKEYFKDIALYGIFVKVIISTLVYQFIISFRNSTRRK